MKMLQTVDKMTLICLLLVVAGAAHFFDEDDTNELSWESQDDDSQDLHWDRHRAYAHFNEDDDDDAASSDVQLYDDRDPDDPAYGTHASSYTDYLQPIHFDDDADFSELRESENSHQRHAIDDILSDGDREEHGHGKDNDDDDSRRDRFDHRHTSLAEPSYEEDERSEYADQLPVVAAPYSENIVDAEVVLDIIDDSPSVAIVDEHVSHERFPIDRHRLDTVSDRSPRRGRIFSRNDVQQQQQPRVSSSMRKRPTQQPISKAKRIYPQQQRRDSTSRVRRKGFMSQYGNGGSSGGRYGQRQLPRRSQQQRQQQQQQRQQIRPQRRNFLYWSVFFARFEYIFIIVCSVLVVVYDGLVLKCCPPIYK